MRLLISKEYNQSMDTDNYCIKCSMLSEKGPHLFIASNKWDEICVELCPELPDGCLEFLPRVCSTITIRCSGNINDYIKHLIELYPEKAGSLRRCLMTGKGAEIVLREYLRE